MTEIITRVEDESVYRAQLSGKKIAVIGYGNQGRSQALNMRDSGLDVIVGNPRDSYLKTATEDGFQVKGISEAVAESDIIFYLIPDEVQKDVFDNQIAPNLKKGSTVVFASGYNYFYGYIKPDDDIDVIMIAPRMIGWGLRDMYLKDQGFPVLAAVGSDHTGKALETMTGLCIALGVLKKSGSIVMSSFKEETLLDLLTEQSWAGSILYTFRAYYEVVTELGCSPEAAILEMYASGELAEIADSMKNIGLFRQLRTHSHTSQYGQLTRGQEYIGEATKELMRKNAGKILDGTFAREWTNEQQTGQVVLNRTMQEAKSHPMEAAEHKLYKILQRGE